MPLQAMQPTVNITLPEVRKFRGKDDDARGILDLISRIEKNVEYEFPEEGEGKV